MDSFQPYPSCHITFKNQSLLQWQIILWKIKRKHKYPFLILYFYILHPQLKSPGNSCALECPQGSERLSCTTSCIRWYAQRSMELSPSTMGWEHCHHNCLEAFSAELKFLPLNFLWCMDHGLFKLTQTVEAMTQGWGTDCLQWHCIFFPSTCSGRAETQMIMTQERRSVETSGWDGGPRAGGMLGTSDEVLSKLSSALYCQHPSGAGFILCFNSGKGQC